MTTKPPLRNRLITCLLGTSPFSWILAGFALTYLLFFIRPLFFSAPAMRNPEPLPIHETIGLDLEQMLSYCHAWLIEKDTPYIGNNLYPPLAVVLFSPLLYVDFASAYRLVTIITIICFVSVIYLLSRDVKRQPQKQSIILLVLVSGLLSYGFQFEIERGQFNLIAVSLSLLGVWVYHHFPRQRLWAYLLFSLSVQLKVYPLIFMVLLVCDWRAWKANLTRFGALLAANIALLFVLGTDVFNDFMQAITAQAVAPDVWNGNHSVHAFTAFFCTMPISAAGAGLWLWAALLNWA